MGANPNGRGRTDEQTPLNVCLKLIGILKDPRRSKNDQLSMPITPEALDSIRRVAHGASGFTLDDQLKSLEQMGRSPEFQEFKSLAIDLMYQRISENMALDEMRRVASLLITAGADVNAEHSSPIKGYTPLMLAAEIDEVDIFEIMLVHGGDTAKTYIDPKSGRAVSILDIARYFDSRSILHLMDRIAPILNGSDRL